MPLPNRYTPSDTEPRLQALWQQAGIYHFDPAAPGDVYAIDTPPPTVSGNLHLGHVYSYSHTDFMARYFRMRGRRVFYPMGYDDNGLPTERLVEKRLGITAAQVGRQAFIARCLEISEEAEKDYQALWQRLGLSIDWRYTYRTIDERSRRTSQSSFLDLYRQGLAYRQEAPAIWCPECRTAIAQAELNDLERDSEFVTLSFRLDDGAILPIATTRPELLPACVAVFVHPEDARYRDFLGRVATVPLFDQAVPILPDPAADPEKGTGAVMCCTFGDTADVAWWRLHHLPLVEAIGRDGRMTAAAGPLSGQTVPEARRTVKSLLADGGWLLERTPTRQSVRVHERCDTPVEYIVARQWFIRILDHRQEFLDAGERVRWHPESMGYRYRAWVENLNWDWGISRQRYFGVPFPLWYCRDCGEVLLASPEQLPVDPTVDCPPGPCPRCGSAAYLPEEDIFDTWATSSMTPQIVGRWLDAGEPHESRLYPRVFPFSLRPQAHEIIRTWAFYTIVKSHYHFGALPWTDVMISGWGLAGEGMAKISKSRGGGPMAPMEMIARYSADALRYWAASTSTGKDALISEEKIQMGSKLATKLWNVARFAERFLGQAPASRPANLSPADAWLLSRLQRLVRRVTALFDSYDYAAAKSETEAFFWRDLADNYLEMCKARLYGEDGPSRDAARFTLRTALLTLLKLFAPLLPYVTEEIYQGLFAAPQTAAAFDSLHASAWPQPDPALESDEAETLGETLVGIATAVRRYKTENSLSLGAELEALQLAAPSAVLAAALLAAVPDLASITRARRITIFPRLDPSFTSLPPVGDLQIGVQQ